MSYREHFSIPDDILYLNTPGNGLLPKQTHAWRREWESLFFDVSGDLRDKQADFLYQVKAKIAAIFSASIDHTFLTPNFSFGYNTLIDLLPKDFKFLVLADEYPSLQYPLINRQLKHVTVPVCLDVEAEIRKAVEQEKPDVFVFSMIQYITGMKIDLDFIKQLKQDFPSLLIIADGTQFMGTAVFQFNESGIDALACSGYKWLLSGFGNGFISLSHQMTAFLKEELRHIPKSEAAMWQQKSLLSTFFEPGHQDTLAHGTLGQSIQFLQDIGLDHIEQHLQVLADEAYELLTERNLLLAINQRAIKSTLINIQIDPSIYPNLLNRGIKCFPRGSGIRIGLHLYNTKKDIHRLIETIESLQ